MIQWNDLRSGVPAEYADAFGFEMIVMPIDSVPTDIFAHWYIREAGGPTLAEGYEDDVVAAKKAAEGAMLKLIDLEQQH